MSDNDRVFREYERVLDLHHRTFAFWSLPAGQDMWSLLAGFDLFTLPLMICGIKAYSSVSVAQRVKSFHDALVYATRFMHSAGRHNRIDPISKRQAIEHAMEFLDHCRHYSDLVDMHMGHGRGLYSVSVDEKRKVVRFISNRVDGATTMMSGLAEGLPEEARHRDKVMEAAQVGVQPVKQLLEVPVKIDNGHIVISDFRPMMSREIEEAMSIVTQQAERALPKDADLQGFTLSQLRSFWKSLLTWSATAAYHYLDKWHGGAPQEKCLPTQFVLVEEFISNMSLLSGLDSAAVGRITDRLTFGNLLKNRPDIFLQPLVRSGSHIAWSPHLVSLIKFERNMLKLMARVPSLKPCADNLIGSAEVPLARRLGQILASHGYQYKTMTELLHGSGELDLLAFTNRAADEMLVVELKGCLTPDDVNEVDHSTKEQLLGQSQLEKAIELLSSYDMSQRKSVWSQPRWTPATRFYGLVITVDMATNPAYDHRETPAIAVRTIEEYFYSADFKSPRRIQKAASGKRWLRRFKEHDGSTWHKFVIGDITYELPLVFEERPDA